MDDKLYLLFKCLLVVFMCFSVNTNISFGADRISANQSLSGYQTILSSGGSFVLGFFKPGNSSKYYIGIWYNKDRVPSLTTVWVKYDGIWYNKDKVPSLRAVWVANRETPVLDASSSELRISGGNLVLYNESSYPIWSTNLTSTNSSSVEAVLNDNGNLVLSDGSNSSQPLWQSFDHPADTWLPGGKLGLNKITKKHALLTSWKSEVDPAPGLFSLMLDPNGSSQYFILWNLTKQFWTSGVWDENARIFTQVPEMRENYIYNFRYVNNENESYFTYDLYNSSLISRFTMDWGGQIQQSSWLKDDQRWFLFWSQPRAQCNVYAYCGAFGSCNANSKPFCKCLKGFNPMDQADWDSASVSGGCTRRTTLQCENPGLVNGKNDGFFTNYNMKLPDNNQTLASGSAKGCKSICLSNCSCSAYAYDNNQCLIWYGNILNVEQLADGDSNAQTLYVKLAPSELSSSNNNKGVVIGGIVGAVVLVVLVGLIVLMILRRKRAGNPGKVMDGSLMVFGYRDLQNATKNFSEKLGGGGFGSVFKGVLPDSSVIAVKKLESISQGEKQFRTEVSTNGTIQHVNLVRLRGFCSEGSKKLLVYEYMSYGSLDTHIFIENNTKILDWKTRYNIALGTARGLAYLHEKCRDCIIHCDIKPENILLDAEFGPKVADFGLAKLVGREFSRVLTTMRGTRGYLAPEWISGVAITAKADVYSYGMMLFEIVSGRRNSEQTADGRMRFFPTWATNVITEGRDVMSLLDPWLEGNANLEELTRVCKVACWCIQDDETQRPSMGQVVQILEGIQDVAIPPIPRSLQVFVDNQEQVIFFTESSSTQSSLIRSNNSTDSSQTKSSSSNSRPVSSSLPSAGIGVKI